MLNVAGPGGIAATGSPARCNCSVAQGSVGVWGVGAISTMPDCARGKVWAPTVIVALLAVVAEFACINTVRDPPPEPLAGASASQGSLLCATHGHPDDAERDTGMLCATAEALIDAGLNINVHAIPSCDTWI